MEYESGDIDSHYRWLLPSMRLIWLKSLSIAFWPVGMDGTSPLSRYENGAVNSMPPLLRYRMEICWLLRVGRPHGAQR